MLQTGSAAVSSFILLAVLLILPTYLSAQKMSEKLTFNVKHISEDLRVSDVSDPQWKTAYHLEVTRYWDGSDAPLGRRATVRLLWSDKAIYLRFDANQAEPLVVAEKPDLTKKAMNLWDRDVVEVFLAPDRDQPRKYFEFEA
ncbi:MAG: carbohydrate-binding family 9-like protein, partial [Rhizobacter sp.]